MWWGRGGGDLTGDVVTVGLDVGGEAGVLGDGRAVVIQRREFRGGVSVSRDEDRRQDWERRGRS